MTTIRLPDTDPPERMTGNERLRARSAANAAIRRYPGPVGEALSCELLTWHDFGYRFDSTSLIGRLIDELMKPPPAPKPPA